MEVGDLFLYQYSYFQSFIIPHQSKNSPTLPFSVPYPIIGLCVILCIRHWWTLNQNRNKNRFYFIWRHNASQIGIESKNIHYTWHYGLNWKRNALFQSAGCFPAPQSAADNYKPKPTSRHKIAHVQAFHGKSEFIAFQAVARSERKHFNKCTRGGGKWLSGRGDTAA